MTLVNVENQVVSIKKKREQIQGLEEEKKRDVYHIKFASGRNVGNFTGGDEELWGWKRGREKLLKVLFLSAEEINKKALPPLRTFFLAERQNGP